ncbi:MAG: ATP-dependent protease [Rhodobacterales bacterium]|nr:MAG: ATP-dependent protease [Rhodobacterales bacterium]
MIKSSDYPDTLPLFVLSEALLLPRTRIQLNVFEPRYLAMVEDVLKTRDRLIGMIQPQRGAADGTLYNIGCAGRLSGFIETDDGRYLITLTGLSRYEIIHQLEGDTPYTCAQVSWQNFTRDLGGVERSPGFDRARFLHLLERFFALEELEVEWDNLQQAEPEMLINSLSMLAPFSCEDKQALLEVKTLQERCQMLMVLMEFALQRGETGGGLQ